MSRPSSALHPLELAEKHGQSVLLVAPVLGTPARDGDHDADCGEEGKDVLGNYQAEVGERNIKRRVRVPLEGRLWRPFKLTGREYSFTTRSTLPTLTYTSYVSTSLIPSGPSRQIDKRAVATAVAIEARALQTPKPLQTCSALTLSAACDSFLQKPTTTITTTSTCYPCTTTTTTTATYIVRTVYTSTVTNYPLPAPVVVTNPTKSVRTLTVPSECAGPAYVAPEDNSVPPGTGVYPLGYPYFTLGSADCCVICHRFTNCIASAYIPGSGSCTVLINGEPQLGPFGYLETGPGGCPAGILNYNFGPPVEQTDIENNIYIFPGPCGR